MVLFPRSLKRGSNVLPELMSSKPANYNIIRIFISSLSAASRCSYYPNYKINTIAHYVESKCDMFYVYVLTIYINYFKVPLK